MGGFDGLQIDSHADFVFFSNQPNHSSLLRKALGVANRENAPAFQGLENRLQASGRRLRDEQDMTGLDLFYSTIPFNDQRPVVHLLTPHHFVQVSAEGILSQDANDQRGAWFGKGVGRPLDELSKVEKIT